MYTPPHFAETRLDVLHQLMHDHPLGTLVTLEAGGLSACHIPFEIAPATAEFPHGVLRGHVARNNPVWRNPSADVAAMVEAMVIFQGPSAYITPAWYADKHVSGKVVPTYNYAMVHAYGPLRAVDDADWLQALLTRLTNRFEATRPQPWQVADAPADYIANLKKVIIGIEIPLTRVLGSWKTSQNKLATDRATMAAGLRERGDSASVAMAGLVEPVPSL
jgi:transcriptional regulator